MEFPNLRYFSSNDSYWNNSSLPPPSTIHAPNLFELTIGVNRMNAFVALPALRRLTLRMDDGYRRTPAPSRSVFDILHACPGIQFLTWFNLGAHENGYFESSPKMALPYLKALHVGDTAGLIRLLEAPVLESVILTDGKRKNAPSETLKALYNTEWPQLRELTLSRFVCWVAPFVVTFFAQPLGVVRFV
ncbi:hypothetical protein K439DRAFT_1640723 [Ramaria rubella]|nr:hypothetical protein K439DRAFT_1640723 [Ramaria rubella]